MPPGRCRVADAAWTVRRGRCGAGVGPMRPSRRHHARAYIGAPRATGATTFGRHTGAEEGGNDGRSRGVVVRPARPARRDPYPTYERLRDEDPVHYVEQRGCWVLSRFADVAAATCDTETFSSALGLTFEEDEIAKLGLMPTLVMMDRPRHTLYRRLVNAMFTPRAVAEREGAVRGFARACIERIAEMGEADFVTEVASPVPSFVVAAYLGVPEQDRSAFGAWSSAIVQAAATGHVLSAGQALAELYGYFTELAAWKRDHPASDMISVLLDAEVDGRPVSVEEILGFCFVMIAGGNDTASGLLGGTAALLSEHRGQRLLLADDRGLLSGGVEELLRLLSPVQGLSRTTTTVVTVGPPEGRVPHPRRGQGAPAVRLGEPRPTPIRPRCRHARRHACGHPHDGVRLRSAPLPGGGRCPPRGPGGDRGALAGHARLRRRRVSGTLRPGAVHPPFRRASHPGHVLITPGSPGTLTSCPASIGTHAWAARHTGRGRWCGRRRG